MDRKSGRARLSGNVRVTNDTEELTADTVHIYFSGRLDNVKRMVARGKVKIQRDTWLARADSADYYPQEDTGYLEGNGYLRRDGSELWGQRISFNQSLGRLQVEKNVRGVIKTQFRGEKSDD